MEPLIGQVTMFAGNFPPRGWAFCDGQLLPISAHSSLFSILGTTYGGDGRATFALPDLRGRAPVHVGTGPGLEPVQLGAKVGQGPEVHSDLPSKTNVQSGLGMYFIIALEGIFPART